MSRDLYIKAKTPINSLIADMFEGRVIADGGTFEAKNCLVNSLDLALFQQASLIIKPNGRKAGKIFSLKPFDGTGDLTVVRATTKTEVNASGVIVDVPINVPSFDYANGSCPSILVEPQRTNLALNSQSFIPSWSTTPQTNGLIEPTSTIDPQGFTNAVRITNVSGSGALGRIFTVVPGTTYTSSIWVRRVSGTGVVELVNLNGGSISLNLTNEWQRFSVTSTAVSIGRFYIRATIIGDSIEVCGAQLEAGSSATSYIPTVASAVTRNADVISKTGVSGIITITETFEDGSTNVISGSPTSYTMSEGRIKSVVGI